MYMINSIKILRGALGGLAKSANNGLGRDPPKRQMKTIRDMSSIVNKYR